MLGITETTLQIPQIQALINSNDKYDVILGEVSFFQPYLVALAHKFGAPIIDLSPAAPFLSTLSSAGKIT